MHQFDAKNFVWAILYPFSLWYCKENCKKISNANKKLSGIELLRKISNLYNLIK